MKTEMKPKTDAIFEHARKGALAKPRRKPSPHPSAYRRWEEGYCEQHVGQWMSFRHPSGAFVAAKCLKMRPAPEYRTAMTIIPDFKIRALFDDGSFLDITLVTPFVQFYEDRRDAEKVAQILNENGFAESMGHDS